LYSIAAAVPTALVYGILADPFGLSWGLIVVGLVGGWLIGSAIAYGAWEGQEHSTIPALRWTAAVIALGAWLAASVVAYVGSQFFYQAATTPLMDRISVSGFIDYFQGTLLSPTLLALAAMAFMAWRGAR
jgi:hypothetical protein